MEQRSMMCGWRVLGLWLVAVLLLAACSGGVVGSNGAANLDTLKALRLSAGTLQPAFSPDRADYTVRVPRAVDTLRVTPEGSNVLAKIRVNGTPVASGDPSPPIPLAVGDNVIEIQVTSLNEVNRRLYRITVQRLDSEVADDSGTRPGGDGAGGGSGGSGDSGGTADATDASLAALALSGVTLDQRFQSTLHDYTATVAHLVSAVRVTARPQAADARLRIAGAAAAAGQASDPIPLAVGDNRIEIEVTAADGRTQQRYTVTVTRLAAADFAERAVLHAAPAQQGADFGASVAMSGDWMAVGAPWEDGGAGAVYLFHDEGGAWQQSAHLALPGGAGGQFGHSVALDGDTLAVGAPGRALADGAVYVFERGAAGWTQVARLVPDEGLFHGYGHAVALQGDRLVVGNLRHAALPGATRIDVYQRSGGGWHHVQSMSATGFAAGDPYAANLLLHGDDLFIGSFRRDDECRGDAGGDPGRVAVYRWDGGLYRFRQVLSAPHGDGADRFGFSLALDGDTLAVGAPCEDGAAGAGPADNSATQAGAVYTFTRAGDFWTFQARIQADSTSAHDLFGFRVALQGGTLVATALLEDTAAHEGGAAWVFQRSGGRWLQQAELLPSGAHEKDCFGASLAFRGGLLAIGANQEAGYCASPGADPAYRNGAVYLFE